MPSNTNTHTGFATLTSVLVLATLFAVVSVTLSIRTLSNMRTYTAYHQHEQASLLADACAAHALLALTQSLEYEGDESIMVGMLPCTIAPIQSTSSSTRTVQVTAYVADHVHRAVVAVASIHPDSTISSYISVVTFK